MTLQSARRSGRSPAAAASSVKASSGPTIASTGSGLLALDCFPRTRHPLGRRSGHFPPPYRSPSRSDVRGDLVAQGRHPDGWRKDGKLESILTKPHHIQSERGQPGCRSGSCSRQNTVTVRRRESFLRESAAISPLHRGARNGDTSGTPRKNVSSLPVASTSGARPGASPGPLVRLPRNHGEPYETPPEESSGRTSRRPFAVSARRTTRPSAASANFSISSFSSRAFNV